MPARLMIGMVASASSELGPFMPMRLSVVAIIFWAAGTASAGSRRVSTATHCTWWPSTPPAWLMVLAAGMQPAAISGPKLASGPVNGLKLANVRVPVIVLGVVLCVVDPHPAKNTNAATTDETRAPAIVRRATMLFPFRESGHLSDNYPGRTI